MIFKVIQKYAQWEARNLSLERKPLKLLSHFWVLNITFSQKHKGRKQLVYIFEVTGLEKVFTEE